MTGGPCAWEGCDRPGLLTVLVGPDPDHAVADGDYCVPHAALSGGDLRDEQDQPVWVDMANATDHGWAICFEPRSGQQRAATWQPHLGIRS